MQPQMDTLPEECLLRQNLADRQQIPDILQVRPAYPGTCAEERRPLRLVSLLSHAPVAEVRL
ncbi:MAG: hypothetical protein HC913_03010 [Microscillaceae bacterium]|nr:hypothetical protein [Microscillaceae bacterium]